MNGPTVIDWMLVIPDVALWFTVIMSLIAIVRHQNTTKRNTLWEMCIQVLYVFQIILSVVGLLVLNMVN